MTDDTDSPDAENDADILAEEVEAFEMAAKAESDNRVAALDDLRFSRLSEQWPAKVREDREKENRPILTLNKMPAFIRQVVNDIRQNKPQMRVKPVDDNADKATATVYSGLLRNIEYQSKSDIAYDTAVDFAASMGFGYLRISIDYAHDDTFDRVLKIDQVPNPFAVYGDPFATGADSADWNRAFITELMPKDEFEAKYKKAKPVDWSAGQYANLNDPWLVDDQILICESWKREPSERQIHLMSDGSVVADDVYQNGKEVYDAMGLTPTQSRTTNSYKVVQRIMNGAEILETNEWAGRYIPIVPVYGEEVNVEGKRHFKSLIRDAKDAQRMHNYWHTNATELVALAPRVPFIGEEGAFDVDSNWLTANSKSHPYLMYKKGMNLPQRQPIDCGTAAGSINLALQSNDDMKAIMGLYDASLGNRSNETSGVAISTRQHEGDVSTFHFADNLNRAIRHAGVILVDLIPGVYSGQQILRILGEDGQESNVTIGSRPEGQPAMPPESTPMQKVMGDKSTANQYPDGSQHVYDLSVGKYDVAIDTGPNFTTRREQVAQEMMEFVKQFPMAAQFMGDLVVKSLDWPNADAIAERIKAMIPMQAQGGLPPEVQQMIEQGKQKIQELTEQAQDLNAENMTLKGKIADKGNDVETDKTKNDIAKYQAETARLIPLLPYLPPTQLAALGLQVTNDAENTPLTPQPAPQANSGGVALNLPENIGQTLADHMGPHISNAVSHALQTTPINVKMPKMKRTPVRDPKTQLITHTIDEQMPDAPPPDAQLQ